jgi:hypothetical protein
LKEIADNRRNPGLGFMIWVTLDLPFLGGSLAVPWRFRCGRTDARIGTARYAAAMSSLFAF